MRISDWSSDVCSSDLIGQAASVSIPVALLAQDHRPAGACHLHSHDKTAVRNIGHPPDMVHLTRNIGSTASLALLGILRSEEHTSELQSLMRNSYAVFCLKTNKNKNKHTHLSKHHNYKVDT